MIFRARDRLASRDSLMSRARRLGADAEAEGPQAGDHRAPPVVEDGAEATALVARLTKRGDAGPLYELVRRDEKVAIERLQRTDVLARGDHPAEPPTRHGVGL